MTKELEALRDKARLDVIVVSAKIIELQAARSGLEARVAFLERACDTSSDSPSSSPPPTQP